jgi:hypothetical protein
MHTIPLLRSAVVRRSTAIAVLAATAATGAACVRGGGGSGAVASPTVTTASTIVAPPGTPPPATIPATTPPASHPSPALDIRRVDFANMALPADACAMGGVYPVPATGYPLHDGLFQFDGGGVEVNADAIVYGDLTGDGHDEAVVPVVCSTGVGSSTRAHPWVYTPDPNGPGGVRRLPLPALTDATMRQVGLPDDSYTRGPGPITITADTLTLGWMVWRPDAEPVTAGQVLTTRQHWTGTTWQTTNPPTLTDDPNAR